MLACARRRRRQRHVRILLLISLPLLLHPLQTHTTTTHHNTNTGFWYATPSDLAARGLGAEPGRMAAELERIWGHRFAPGRAPGLRFMSHLWEPLRAEWRPLAFYAATELLALLARGAMAAMGFERRRAG